MITESQIYWITRMDGIKAIPIIFAVPLLTIGLCIWISGDHPTSNLYKAAKYWLVGICIGSIFIFIPTTKEMCAIKVIPVIVNDKDVQELPKNVVDLANEWIEELKPKTIKETKQ